MKYALLVVDIQNDFCSGGALAVTGGDEVIDLANRLITLFRQNSWPIYLTRDWHPDNHCSFRAFGGPWPRHCVAGTEGARFHPRLSIPPDAEIISKATTPDKEAYSDFDGTGLARRLHDQEVDMVVIIGLATDYCVRAGALDALAAGFRVMVIREAVRAVDVNPGDGERALSEITGQGGEVSGMGEFLEEMKEIINYKL